MAQETYELKVNGFRFTDIKVDLEAETTEDIEARATAVATEGATAVIEASDITSISIDSVEKYVEIFA